MFFQSFPSHQASEDTIVSGDSGLSCGALQERRKRSPAGSGAEVLICRLNDARKVINRCGPAWGAVFGSKTRNVASVEPRNHAYRLYPPLSFWVNAVLQAARLKIEGLLLQHSIEKQVCTPACIRFLRRCTYFSTMLPSHGTAHAETNGRVLAAPACRRVCHSLSIEKTAPP